MNITQRIPARARWIGAGVGMAAAAYLGRAGWTWLRFGAIPPATPAESEPLLDAFMPDYDIVERHHTRIDAPAAVALAAACEVDLLQSPLARAIFAARALALGGHPDDRPRPRALLPLMQSIGWEVLAQVPGRAVVFGAVTRPWEAEPVFRPVGKGFFAGFNERGYVKITWTLRADPDGDGCLFRTETRACATDPFARARFRRYWAFVEPGVRVIRSAILEPVKREAERRAGEGRAA
jgi:hypothetical protein